jgi:hypothetical protein
LAERIDGLYELGQQHNYLIKKITIPENSIQQIKSELQLSGISEATIFPDLEALSRELESRSELQNRGIEDEREAFHLDSHYKSPGAITVANEKRTGKSG